MDNTEIMPLSAQNIKFLEQHPSIKIYKNTKGKYNWDIKILSLDIDEIERLNNEMLSRFGQ
jgi:hypothetical protein